MVRPNSVARSRACDQCRKKRIKCDLQSPTCQRCIDSNIICSGPITGLLLVTQDSHSFGTQKRKHPPLEKSRGSSQQRPGTAVNVVTDSLVPTAIYDDVLLAKFLNYFSEDAWNRTWQMKLPMLTQAKNHAAMKTAARAVSLAFAAQTLQNTSMAQSARESYGNSLRYHQASFKAPSGKQICKKKALNALPVTILLSYFEMIQATSTDAWLKHSLAAERLYVLLGPDALNDELLNHLYFIVRSNCATRCFLLGTDTQMLETPYSKIPMLRPCGRTNMIFNHLVDTLIWLSHAVNASNYISSSNGLPQAATDLSELWLVFCEQIGLDHIRHPLFPNSLPDVAGETYIPDLPSELQEPSAALSGSFFHAAAILIITLEARKRQQLGSTSITSDPSFIDAFAGESSISTATLFRTTTSPTDTNSIVYHASQIFALASYLRTQQMGCFCLRLILPLAIINRLSPSASQAQLAESFYREWSTSEGLAGISVVAFGERNEYSSIPELG